MEIGFLLKVSFSGFPLPRWSNPIGVLAFAAHCPADAANYLS